MELRRDADKNSTESPVAMAKHNECAARLDEQGHLHFDITELTPGAEAFENCDRQVVDDSRWVLSFAMPAKRAVLTDLHETPRLEARVGLSTLSADCPERTIPKLAKVFNEVYENAEDALQGANSIKQVKNVKWWDNDWKSSLKAMVTLTRTRSMEPLSLTRRSRR